MKRIHLFEFEDFAWFPNWLRMCMTHYIVAIHRLLGSGEALADLIARALPHARQKHILDLCSGSGGPLPEALRVLKEKHSIDGVRLTFSDLYPNTAAARQIEAQGNPDISYLTQPVDATRPGLAHQGLRTMVCSMHHMKPALARAILKDASDSRQPICIFEISDNSAPIWLWWTAIPFSFLMVFFITPLVRPMSWQQLVFTYLIPLIPLFIAWDGAVSNARTYTPGDIEALLEGLHTEGYNWEIGQIKGSGSKMYVLGLPQ